VSEFEPSSKFVRGIVHSLPSSLRSLRLAAANALTAFTGTHVMFESRTSFLAKLTTIDLCDRFSPLFQLNIDARAGLTVSFFRTLPKNLEILVLEGVSAALDESKLPSFPATLRTFRTDAVLIFSAPDTPRMLPDTLEELRCHTTLQEGILKKLCLSQCHYSWSRYWCVRLESAP